MDTAVVNIFVDVGLMTSSCVLSITNTESNAVRVLVQARIQLYLEEVQAQKINVLQVAFSQQSIDNL